MENLQNGQIEGEKIDRRRIKTKKAIKTALITLMTEKELPQITVKELSQKADINRKTFYTHYNNIFNIFDEIENELVQNLKKLIQESGSEDSILNTQHLFEALNHLIYEDFDFYQKLLSHANAYGPLINKIKNVLQEECWLAARNKFDDLPDEFSYVIEFISSGIISMYVSWFDSDRKISLEELAKTAGTLASGGLTGLVQKTGLTPKP